MGDIEFIPCVSVSQNGSVKFKYNLCVCVIQNGWLTLSPFNVLVFYKIDGWNSNTTDVLGLYKMDGRHWVHSMCKCFTKLTGEIQIQPMC